MMENDKQQLPQPAFLFLSAPPTRTVHRTVVATTHCHGLAPIGASGCCCCCLCFDCPAFFTEQLNAVKTLESSTTTAAAAAAKTLSHRYRLRRCCANIRHTMGARTLGHRNSNSIPRACPVSSFD